MYFVPVHTVIRRIVIMFVDFLPDLLENLFAVFRSQPVLNRRCRRRTANLWCPRGFWLLVRQCGTAESKKQQKQKQRARNSPDPGGRWIHLYSRSVTWRWHP